jgi:tRNA pseudouridine55 synthase
MVVALKKIMNIRKIGHTGTLDPGACGVLFVCVGRATKIADYLMNEKKTYIAEFSFGKATDTLDSYGKEEKAVKNIVTYDMLKKACKAFCGKTDQVPPMVSAIKVNGQKMYQVARKGKKVDLPARRIVIYSIDILEFHQSEGTCLLRILCGKGTYIRSLAADMAAKMNTLGHVSFLLRTSAGEGDIRDAYTLDEIKKMTEEGDYSFLESISNALSGYKSCMLDDYLFPIVTTGTPVDLTKIRNASQVPRGEDICVYCKNKLIGIGRAEGDLLKIKTMVYLRDNG